MHDRMFLVKAIWQISYANYLYISLARLILQRWQKGPNWGDPKFNFVTSMMMMPDKIHVCLFLTSDNRNTSFFYQDTENYY